MGKVKEALMNEVTIVTEFVIQIDNKSIQKMKIGMLSKFVDNVEILKPLKKTPGLRVRTTMNRVEMGLDTVDEVIEETFNRICKAMHLKKVVFIKGQVFET